jgi:ADP-ribosylglycohydrolase
MYFLKWLHSPPFDIGNTTYTALSGIPEDINPFTSY